MITEETLREISNSLDITETDFKTLETSYKAIGTYIGNNIGYDVNVFPQGSVNLGTVIKPIAEDGEYDIDLVLVVLKNDLEAGELKEKVGKVLKQSERYSKKISEGKRCWTIQYSEGLNYHVDILPVIESENYKNSKVLKMTNKVNNFYEYLPTNPEKYAEWFWDKCKNERKKLEEEYSFKNKVDIKDVPEWARKTKLQRAVQLLKRYRDICFLDNPEIKPISIILTTLLAEMYTGDESLIELITKFANDFMKYINKDEKQNFVIANPVNPDENFADKWQIYPERQKAFFDFTVSLKENLIDSKILREGDRIEVAKEYSKIFGESVVKDAFKNIGIETRNLRENNQLYMSENGNITNHKDNNDKIGKHTFYGMSN